MTTTVKASEINKLVSATYQECLYVSRKELGKGIYRSRGKFVYIIDKNDKLIPECECEMMSWTGSQKQLNEIMSKYAGVAQSIYIQGGIDYSDSIQSFNDGYYDPMVNEWAVPVYEA